ncbi:MAG: phosphoglycerate dehydrogenase [Candidatus Gastranaerophilales bacterium]|nr:phosphoglycerate dehydrogenase [Candidatus Gastranaerophilales bacterium]
MAKVLITDKINDLAVKIVARVAEVDNLPTMDEDKLCEIIGEYDALLVRSQTKVTKRIIEAGKNLKIIGRAGVGVDNIDVASATEKGIIVVNSPDGNTHAAAEHTIALMMAMSRNIPVADASVKKGLWERSKFTGVEVYNKTLGIIGFGKIGSHVANVALALGMKVVVCDPYANKEIVEKMGATYVEHLDDFWGMIDYLTIHTPKTKETTGLINTNTLNRMKKGVRIINCARGGIIVEADLAKALESGQVAQCAIDVYEDEKNVASSPLLNFERNAILTPHLGASTDEAQINVALDVANQVVDVLSGRNATSAINIPALKPQKLEAVKEYMGLAENIAQVASQISKGAIKELNITVSGKLSQLDVSPLEIAILKGILSANLEDVNYVNAPIIAKQRGIEVKTSKTNDNENSIMVCIATSTDTTVVKGELVAKTIKRITKINEYHTSIEPKEHMLLVPHVNKVGMVAKVANVLGEDDINISGMQVAQGKDDKSIMIISIDSKATQATLDKINKINDILGASYINIKN